MDAISELDIPGFDDVLAAHERIKPHIHRTPVLTSSYFNDRTGAKLYFKCENLQKAGAFKVRGACNAVFGLSDEQASKVSPPIHQAITACRSAMRRGGGAFRSPW